MTLAAGLEATVTRTVGDGDTAIALGSGDVPVLGTPRLIAWCEAATVAAISAELEVGATSVGTSVHVEHLAPTRVGAEVRATAKLETVAGRSLTFAVIAQEGDKLIATGTIARAIVNVERFLS